MKTKILSIIIGLGIAGVVSCDKDFLEEEVFSSLAPSNFYSTAVDAHASLMAAYDAFQNGMLYNLNMISLAGMPTNTLSTRWGDPADNFTEDSQNSWRIPWMWDQVWVANNRINSVIEYVPPIEMDEDAKAMILGEAYFLRALNYFNAVRIWGNIPKIDKPTTSLEGLEYVQVHPDTIYDFIIADLMRAETRLPVNQSEDQTGRATLGAAKTLLGKVYLTLGQWQNAKDKLEEVMEMELYDLFEDYADVFGGRADYTEGYSGANNLTENGIEHIFSIQFISGMVGEGTSKAPEFAVTGSGVLIYEWSDYHCPVWDDQPDFYDSFDPADLRLPVTFVLEYTDKDGVVQTWPNSTTLSLLHIKKYFSHESADWNDWGDNTEVLRYSDVLLMHSEALMEIKQSVDGEVVESINKVRARAGVTEYNPGDWTYDTFRDELQNERNRELCYEGHTWFDYVRKDMLIERMEPYFPGLVSARNHLYPIPYAALQTNTKFDQNEGW
jgi:hypothetical protein